MKLEQKLTINKLIANDIIREIVLKHYLNNKKQTRKEILRNYLSNNNSKHRFRNKYEIESAIMNINNEMEKAQKEFSKLFGNYSKDI